MQPGAFSGGLLAGDERSMVVIYKRFVHRRTPDQPRVRQRASHIQRLAGLVPSVAALVLSAGLFETGECI